MRSSLSLLTISLLFAAPPPKSGIDTTSFDTTCKPCDDFWRFANGGWIDKNPIPANQSGWGTMSVVREGNKERIRVILEAAALAKNAPGSNEQKIGDLYSACMDTARIEKLGAQPIASNLASIGAIDSRAQLKSTLVEFLSEGRGAAPVGISGSPDMKNSSEIIAAVAVSGISLSDRDFYLK
ncbi:MAG: M13 family peptidase, partial [Acidobacteria bacterium]|nr:M13 family peptidase [Acidobacteriota bacterium]